MAITESNLTTVESYRQRDTQLPSGELDEGAFMKLLVAELRNQDPVEPMKAREMITQLSQLTAVERLERIQSGIDGMRSDSEQLQGTDMAVLVGRTVTADMSSLALATGGVAQGGFKLGGEAANVAISIENESGQEVRLIQLENLASGAHGFTWDGKDVWGEQVPSGNYDVRIFATNAAGEEVPASTEVAGMVTGVSFESGSPKLVVGSSHLRLEDVSSIRQ